MPSHPPLPTFTPEQLLRASQAAGPYAKGAQDRVVDVFGETLRKLAARTCRRYFLKPQERDDVLSETYQQLFNPKIVRFVPQRGQPERYFRGRVQNAARKIMAQLGVRRRKAVPLEAKSTPGRQGGTEEAENSSLGRRYITPAPSLSPVESAEMRDLVKFIMEQAPPRVRKALQLCYWDGWTSQAIAAHLGASRFTLAREIGAFFKKITSQLDG